MIILLLFLFILTVYTFIYNVGVFIPAKIFKVRIEEFYVWYKLKGSKIFKYKGKSGTEFGLGWLPFGGHFKMSGTYLEDEEEIQPYFFISKPVWQQLVIMLGGPILVIIIALAYYSYLKSIPILVFLVSCLESLFLVSLTIFIIYNLIAFYEKRIKRDIRFSKLNKTILFVFSSALYLSFLIVLFVNINETIPFVKYLNEMFFNRKEFLNVLSPLTFYKVERLIPYCGIISSLMNVILFMNLVNIHRIINLFYNSFFGRDISGKIIGTYGMISVPISLGFQVYVVIFILQLIFFQ